MAVIRDKASLEWRAVKEHCDKRLQEMREENDHPLPEVETATLRGQIQFANEILDLGVDDDSLAQVKQIHY